MREGGEMTAPSTVKITKNGVTYESNAELFKYTIAELTRAAMKDVGKFISKRTRQKIHRRTGRLAKNIQYWVRKKDLDLQVGFKPGGFYGGFQEIGTKSIPKQGILTETTREKIEEIRKIEGHYLSYVEDIEAAKRLINEEEEIGDEND
jgi:HK97 gp10 family phage protein